MAKFERNPFPYPMIQYEELWDKPLTLEGYDYDWKYKVPTHQRLYLNNTLASIRQKWFCKHPCAPKDALDICLTSVYDHNRDSFLPKTYPYIQPETIGLSSYRLLKNRRYVPERRPARDLELDETVEISNTPIAGTMYHGVRIGGLNERQSPYYIKLGISSSHSSTSNGGYSRKVDGTFFTS